MESTEKLALVEEIDFQKYWLVLKRRWLPAVSVCISVTGLVAGYLLLQKPAYEATGKLLIKSPNNVTSALREEKSGQKSQDFGEISSLGSKSDPLQTETELIRSTPVLQQTIETLNLTNQQGEPLIPQTLLGRLSLKNIPATDILEVTYESPDPEEAARVTNQLMQVYLQNNILANRDEAVTARKFISQQLPKTEANVSQAEAALRRFKEKYNVVALDEEASSSVSTTASLEDQVAKARAELNDVSAHAGSLRNQLGMSSKAAVTASSLGQDPGVRSALEELRQVESQLAVERTRFQETHPAIVELRQKQSALRNQLQGQVQSVSGQQTQQPGSNVQTAEIKQQLSADLVRVEADRLGLENRVATLSNVLAAQQQRAGSLPQLEQRQNELERTLEAAQSTYNTLLKRLEEIRVEENRNVANARIVETADIPASPAAANKKLKLAAGGIFGLLLGIATAFLLDLLDPSLKTVRESKELFGYTVLGIIPAFDKSKKLLPPSGSVLAPSPLLVRDLPRSPISETYRMVQANLKYLNTEQVPKVIVVTSSVPQEGKSTLCANLATAMARPGRQVLLVDGDMRRPSQHHIWNLSNKVGLSEVLSEQVDLQSVTNEVLPYLEVLTAGKMPLNPVDLLDSPFTTTFIHQTSSRYDFVIIDTPGLNIAADASILGKMADGVLLVVRPGVVDHASAAASQDLLQKLGQNVLGQVVNGVSAENDPYGRRYAEYYSEEDAFAGEIFASKSQKRNP